MLAENYKHTDITDLIIKGFYKVYNKLGYGFLEKIYENSLSIELQNLGLIVRKQVAIEVYYFDNLVGGYYADLLVNDLVRIELKAAENLMDAHEAQLTNYLKATNIEVGLLLNFGKKPQVKRKVFSNN